MADTSSFRSTHGRRLDHPADGGVRVCVQQFMPMQDDVDDVMTRLQHRFDFDDEDLRCNQNGEFSQRQRDDFAARRPPVKTLLVIVLVSLGAGALALTNHRRSTADFRRSRDLELLPLDWSGSILAFVLVLAFLSVPLLGMWWFINRWPLRRGPKVRTGPVTVYRQRIRYTSVPAVRFDNGLRSRWFIAKEGDAALFEDFPAGTLYYSQGNAKTVVHSIERAPLDDETM